MLRVIQHFQTTRASVFLAWAASKNYFIYLVFSSILLGLLPVAETIIFARLVNKLSGVLESGSSHLSLSNFFGTLSLLAAIHITGQILSQINTTVTELYQTKLLNYTEQLISRKIVTIELAQLEDSDFHNELQSVVRESMIKPYDIVQLILSLIANSVSSLAVIIILLSWKIWSVPVLLVVTLVYFYIQTYFGQQRLELRFRRAEMDRKASYFNFILTADWAVKELKLFGLGNYFVTNLEKIRTTMYNQDSLLSRKQVTALAITQLVTSLLYPALIVLALNEVLTRQIDIGQFLLYSQSILQLSAAAIALMLTLGSLVESNLYVSRLFTFLNTTSEDELKRVFDIPSAESSSPSIEFSNVTFRYPNAQNKVVDQITFKILPGEIVTFVGENGAGKSTILKLMMGLYMPSGGEIFVNGASTSTVNSTSLREKFGMVFQDYLVFHLSAGENIGVGFISEIQNMTRVANAAKKSGFDRVIGELPYGYETIMAPFFDHGHQLSGGQAQLLAISRALMRDPEILILDEPSSSLDVYTERKLIDQILSDRRSNRTVILISHRMKVAKLADKIFVINDGELVEQGSHEELIDLRGVYAKMYQAQDELY